MPKNQTTIIITSTDKLWEQAQDSGTYSRSTIDKPLEEVGFIHATSPDQTIDMLNRHFTDRDDVLLLLADLSKITPEVKFEKALSGRGGLFPHIYGPLNTDAVRATIKPHKNKSNHFIEPEELGRLNNG